MDDTKTDDLKVLQIIIAALKTLDSEAQKRTIQAVTTFLGINDIKESISSLNRPSYTMSFSENRDMSPKDFLREKLPRTDIERVACLAYYLTHYKGMPHFKTLDISSLNTEAAQPKFSNTAYAMSNAIRGGFLVSAAKGSNQLSAAGESFVQSLPDHEAAKASLANMRIKKRTKKSAVKKSK